MSNYADEAPDHADDLTPQAAAALDALTERQRKLVLLVAQGVGQVEAGRQAGYAGKWIDSIVSRELRKAKLQRALEALLADGAGGSLVLDREAIKRELSKIGMTGHASSRVRALEALDRIDAREQPAAQHPLHAFRERVARAGGMEGFRVQLLEQQVELVARQDPAWLADRPELRARALAAAELLAAALRPDSAPG